MASPYLAMALFPGLYRYLPKPGPWTMHLERILGFMLAATCVYLFGLLPTSEYVSVLVLLWVIALAAWMWGQWTNLNQTPGCAAGASSAGIGMVILASALLFRPANHPNPWQDFTMSQFEAMRGRQHLILDFTADWCPNCKFLEKPYSLPQKAPNSRRNMTPSCSAWT